jgi:hypothetical protein
MMLANGSANATATALTKRSRAFMRSPPFTSRSLSLVVVFPDPDFIAPGIIGDTAKADLGLTTRAREQHGAIPTMRELAVSSGFLRADDGIRTHDLLHGKQML